jgi:hypothetical protein
MSKQQETKSQRISAGNFRVVHIASGKPIGLYGGRDGARWAQCIDGDTITEESTVSTGTLRGMITHHARAKGLI